MNVYRLWVLIRLNPLGPILRLILTFVLSFVWNRRWLSAALNGNSEQKFQVTRTVTKTVCEVKGKK